MDYKTEVRALMVLMSCEFSHIRLFILSQFVLMLLMSRASCDILLSIFSWFVTMP